MIKDYRELTPLILDPPPNVVKVLDEESFQKLLDYLDSVSDFGYDVETTPVDDFYIRRMRTMQFGDKSVQYVIDLRAFCDNSPELLYNCQGEYGKNLHLAPKLKNILDRLKKYLCSSKWLKVGVNLSFEYECLYWMFGIRSFGYYDCMMAEKCIYAGLGGSASLKNYGYYAMDSMVERYFGKTIDKSLQTSFNLDDIITDEQYEYAALDTRVPQAIRTMQEIIASGETYGSLRAKGKVKLAENLYYLDDIILGDILHEVIELENNAIGSFVDMHLHGERIDIERWLDRTKKADAKLQLVIAELDKFFLPIVGSKNDIIDEDAILKAEEEWKVLTKATDEEVLMKLEISKLNRALKKNPEDLELRLQVSEVEIKLDQWEQARKAQKETLKKKHGDMKKRRTKINKLRDKCEGEALINYGSDTQLLKCLKENVKVLSKLEGLDDEILEKYEKIHVVDLIRQYHGLSKEVGTYGYSWASKWVTHPCKEEGWLHPYDGRLHCVFNQLDAATGRSSSEKPNGQNLPQDKEVRSSFIADPPDESIRISDCCEGETSQEPWQDYPVCHTCGNFCKTHAEEYVIVTADMSGAELRIIAEAANDLIWIGAFNRGEDVHSVGTEILYEAEWPKHTLKSILKPDGWTLADCKSEIVKTILDEDGKEKKIGPCAYYALKENGEYTRKKCNCPGHNELRNGNKATNFLLAYGGSYYTLAKRIKQPTRIAKELMALHEQKFPAIWQYLEKSGNEAALHYKAFDLYGRRRLLPEPTHERALENCKEWNEKDLRLDEEQCENNINVWIQVHGKKPNQLEEFELTHRPPNAKEIGRSYYQMKNSITRQGKNHRIQGTNASIAKIAMGSGFDPDGKPFLWHILSQYKAKLIKFVHDELVVQCPKRFGKQVADLIGDAFKRAAAIKMKKVIMEFDYAIANHWKK